ncbi:MAG: PDZ domain-containing protein [Balneolaceae bacterium]
MARTIMESLITEGRVIRGYIGISGSAVNEVMARALGLESERGIIIGEVVPESAAERAGLQEGDVILEKNGEPIQDWNRFATEVAGNAPGTEIDFLIYRDGERRTVTVVLDEYPDEESMADMSPDEAESLEEELGFRVENLTDSIRRQLQLDSSVEGAVVTDIQQNSHAYRQGLRSGDVITQIQNLPVRTGEEFYSGVRELRSSGQDAALLRVNRRGQQMFIAFELP